MLLCKGALVYLKSSVPSKQESLKFDAFREKKEAHTYRHCVWDYIDESCCFISVSHTMQHDDDELGFEILIIEFNASCITFRILFIESVSIRRLHKGITSQLLAII
jgi:hypothetical protein